MGKKAKVAEVEASADTSAPSANAEANQTKLDANNEYIVVAITTTKNFKEGFEMVVNGVVAEILIGKNQVKLKE